MNRRIGGVISIKADGNLLLAKGAFTHNIQDTEKEMIPGQDGVHGFMEKPVVPYIEGSITDNDELDIEDLYDIRDATITLEQANGKVVQLREAVFAGRGEVNTEQGEITVRFEGISGREIR